MKWITKTLGQIYDLEGGKVQTGPFGSQLHESDYTQTGIPVIMPKDIVNDQLDLSSIARISKDDANRLSKHLVRVNDVIFPRRGEINKRVLIDEANSGSFCGTGCIRLRGTGKMLNPKYLFYYLKQKSVVRWIENQAIGATMMNLNTTILRSIPIYFPEKNTDQKKIAAILSAYDDLIENNNQRIRLLEEMAEEVYKEWFVRLRFPGYQEATFRDKDGKVVPHGTVGALPEGWDNGKLSMFTSIIKRGISPTYDENGETYVLNQRCIRDNRINTELARKQSKKIPAEKFVQLGDVLVNSTGEGTLGRVAQVQEDYKGWSVDSHVTIIRPSSKVDINYFGTALMNKQVIFESLAFGSTGQTELGREDVQKMRLIIPCRELQDMFGNLISPMRKEINILLQKNQVLRETRDLLLPRLISGKLRVDDLEIDTL